MQSTTDKRLGSRRVICRPGRQSQDWYDRTWDPEHVPTGLHSMHMQEGILHLSLVTLKFKVWDERARA